MENMRNKRYIMGVIGCLLMLLLTAACGADQNSDPGSGDREDPGSITLYYVDETWTGFNPQSMDIDQVASVENVIDTVMIALIEGGDSDTAVAPVAPGMTYQRYTYDGAKTINLIFNVDWESTDAYAVLLSKAAFVRTICQITPLDKVVFELVDMSNESNVIKEELTEDSFADENNMMNSDCEAHIYLPDKTGKYLIEKTVILDRASRDTLAVQILQELTVNYDDTLPPFNTDTVVKSVSVADGVCTVTFNEKFASGTQGVDDEVVVYSIVDTLTDLDGIDSVVITVDNTNNRLNNIDLSKKLFRNATYIR